MSCARLSSKVPPYSVNLSVVFAICFIFFGNRIQPFTSFLLSSLAHMAHKVVHAYLRQKPRHPSPARLLPSLFLASSQTRLEVPLGDNARDLQQHRRLFQAEPPGLFRDQRPFSALDCWTLGRSISTADSPPLNLSPDRPRNRHRPDWRPRPYAWASPS